MSAAKADKAAKVVDKAPAEKPAKVAKPKTAKVKKVVDIKDAPKKAA